MPVVDLFCGCGGLSCGFHQVNFNIVAAYDNWRPAIECYNNNILGNHAHILDLSNVDLAIEVIQPQNPRMIIGSPPCQEFSNAGRREEGEKADLTYSFAEIVTQVLPQFFVMENVPRVRNSKIYRKARRLYKQNGYGLTEVIVDASRCGVPQSRSRFFCIGALGVQDDFLLGDILGRQTNNPISVQDYFARNGYPLDIVAYYRHPTTYSRRAVFNVNEVSPTIRGVNRPRPGTYRIHNNDAIGDLAINQIRKLTLLERAHIQTFPPEYTFEGLNISNADLEQMVGNAVPVGLARFIADCLQRYIRGEVMEYETNFAKWLREHKNYSDRTISDTFSRINRAKNFLATELIDRHYIADLEEVPDFRALSTDIKSQIRRALKQKIEFDNQRSCDKNE